MFNFTENNWNAYIVGRGVGAPIPGAVLTGSFTGQVEANGTIEQADLLSFNASITIGGVLESSLLQGNLSLFEYNTNGGASGLDFAGFMGESNNSCVGAATALDANCTLDFLVAYPAGTVGVVDAAGLPNAVSSSFPVVTLESSFTPLNPTPVPAPVTQTPEPATFLLTGTLLACLVLMQRRRAALARLPIRVVQRRFC